VATTLKLSASSRALEKELRPEGATSRLAKETGIHRTQLWRYSSGRQKPDAEQIARLHRATKGRVRADGWETLQEIAA